MVDVNASRAFDFSPLVSCFYPTQLQLFIEPVSLADAGWRWLTLADAGWRWPTPVNAAIVATVSATVAAAAAATTGVSHSFLDRNLNDSYK